MIELDSSFTKLNEAVEALKAYYKEDFGRDLNPTSCAGNGIYNWLQNIDSKSNLWAKEYLPNWEEVSSKGVIYVYKAVAIFFEVIFGNVCVDSRYITDNRFFLDAPVDLSECPYLITLIEHFGVTHLTLGHAINSHNIAILLNKGYRIYSSYEKLTPKWDSESNRSKFSLCIRAEKG